MTVPDEHDDHAPLGDAEIAAVMRALPVLLLAEEGDLESALQEVELATEGPQDAAGLVHGFLVISRFLLGMDAVRVPIVRVGVLRGMLDELRGQYGDRPNG